MKKVKPTHYIICNHCQGGNDHEYRMECLLLKITKNGKAKILLFGERYWKNREHKRTVKYIDRSRLIKIDE